MFSLSSPFKRSLCLLLSLVFLHSIAVESLHAGPRGPARPGGKGPRRAILRFAVEGARIKWSRNKGRIIPRALLLADRELPFEQKKGIWGVRMPLREMTEIAPSLQEELHRTIAGLAVERVRTLVAVEDGSAEAFAEAFRRHRGEEAAPPEEEERAEEERGSRSGKGSGKGASSSAGKASSSRASAATASSVEAETSLTEQLDQSYAQVLDSSGFFFPQVQPGGIGAGTGHGHQGWELVDNQESETMDDEEGGSGMAAGAAGVAAGTSGQAGGSVGDGEDEHEEADGSWITSLGVLVLVVVALVAPIAAALWLCSQALTIASVVTSLLGQLGAVTAAGTFYGTCEIVDTLFSDQPFVQKFDETTVWTNPDPDSAYLGSLQEGDTVDAETWQRWSALDP